MAIIYSYPEKTTPAGGDLLVITDSEQPAPKKNRTKSLKVSDLGDYIITSNSVITGGGTLNTIAMFTPDGQKIGDSIMSQNVGNTEIQLSGSLAVTANANIQSLSAGYLPVPNYSGGDLEDSQLQQSPQLSSGLYQIKFNNADRFIINKPSSITSGDPEYLIQQDGNYKVSFGWDDDGGGFGYIYNWAGNGLRLGAAGQNPQLELDTVVPQIISHTAHLFDGTAQFEQNIQVNAAIEDGLGNTGTAGQVLSSTGTQVEWVDNTATGTVTGTGTTNTLPVWTNGPNGEIGDSKVYQDNSNIRMLAGSPNGAKCDYSFGIETFSGQKQGTTNGFEFKTGGQSGGFYKSGNFRFERKLAVGRNTDPQGATLDVGFPTDLVPAAWFRNGVVVSNNPSGVSVDNTSMVIGGGNNDIVSGSDSCLAVGNNNQILSDSDNSLVVGQGNIIRNDSDNCFAIGQSNVIDGTNTGTNSVRSQVLGYDNSLSGSYSSFIAGGDNTVTTGNNAFALGYSHTLQGIDSQFAFGENCTGPASGQNTFMMGSALTGSDKSMAVGFRNDTSSYPTIDYPNGLGETKFVVSVGSAATSNAIIITEGGVNRGNPNVEQIPRIILPQQETLEFISDSDATAAGIPTGGLYRSGNDLKINFNETAAGGNEGLAYLTPQLLTASAGGSGNVDPNYNLVLLGWTLGNGVYTLNLPLASANTNRLIRITTDGSLALGAGDKIDITATGGETIDGNPSFQISKRYEGLAVYSTGSEWIIVQAKAH